MKIDGVEANYYEIRGKRGVEVLARFTDDEGTKLTACVNDYEGNWFACVGLGFSTADSEPCEETIYETRNRGTADASEYGNLFEMMADLAGRMRSF